MPTPRVPMSPTRNAFWIFTRAPLKCVPLILNALGGRREQRADRVAERVFRQVGYSVASVFVTVVARNPDATPDSR
ncbi:hypothetical protein GCM10027267_08020 [Paramicrobacterium agarici]